MKLDAEEYNIFVVISDAAVKIQRLFRSYRSKKIRSTVDNKVKKHTFSFGGTSSQKHEVVEKKTK